MTDIALASIAAATGAGYVYATTTDKDGVFVATLEGQLTGGSHQSHQRLHALGRAATLNAATTAALAALNYQRGHRYGFGTTVQVNDDGHDVLEVQDVT